MNPNTHENDEPLLNAMLTTADVECIYYLRNKYLKPKSIQEFFVALETLNEDLISREKILAHTGTVFYNVIDFYKTRDNMIIELILSYL